MLVELLLLLLLLYTIDNCQILFALSLFNFFIQFERERERKNRRIHSLTGHISPLSIIIGPFFFYLTVCVRMCACTTALRQPVKSLTIAHRFPLHRPWLWLYSFLCVCSNKFWHSRWSNNRQVLCRSLKRWPRCKKKASSSPSPSSSASNTDATVPFCFFSLLPSFFSVQFPFGKKRERETSAL